MNVRVAVRSRPLSDKENREATDVCLRFPDARSVVIEGPRTQQFTFDHAYQADSSQEQVYEDLGKVSLFASCLLLWEGGSLPPQSSHSLFVCLFLSLSLSLSAVCVFVSLPLLCVFLSLSLSVACVFLSVLVVCLC